MKIKLVLLGYILFTSLFISLYSCKKDYPQDTPKWLKQKIKEIKKREDPIGSPNSIEEYKKGETIIYAFDYIPFNGGWNRYDFYDYSGNKICSQKDDPNHYGCIINGDTIFKEYTKNRYIWICEFCE
jgi:hypothetical protein